MPKLDLSQRPTSIPRRAALAGPSAAAAADADTVLGLWRQWVQANDAMMRLFRQRDSIIEGWLPKRQESHFFGFGEATRRAGDDQTEQVAALEAAIEPLAWQADELMNRILESRSAAPAAIAAKVHIALEFTGDRGMDELPSSCLAAVLRDLLPSLPPDMAERLAPLTEPEADRMAALGHRDGGGLD